MIGGTFESWGYACSPTQRIKAAPIPPPGKQSKLADADGLYLLIRRGAQGTSYLWRLKFRIDGKESSLGFGPWPEVSIEKARAAALEARRQLRTGEDPAELRRAERSQATTEAASTFSRAAREYLQLDTTKAGGTRRKHEWLFECLAKLHGRSLASIKTAEILTECRRLEAKGQRETAHRVAGFARRVFRYARQAGMTENNPADDLEGALKPVERESIAAVTDPRGFGILLRAIDSLASGTTRHAMQLLALVATRPGELRQMEWGEVDTKKAEWLVPVKRTKMRKAHWVPLSKQALAILEAQREISGGNRFVFPQDRDKGRAMSDGTLSAALAQIGYKPGHWITIDPHSPHGFRSSFSTIMNAQGADPAIIERCLSHGPPDKLAAVYNRHKYQNERRQMMQTWADLIDKLRKSK